MFLSKITNSPFSRPTLSFGTQKQKQSEMALLTEFFKELGSGHCNATFVEIVSDNAKTPSEHLRSCTPVRRSRPAKSSRVSRYNSGCSLPQLPSSAHRSLGRYNSEPIQISPLASLNPTGSTRWAPSALCHNNNTRDSILILPTRSEDRWAGVTRNNSDSALLSILPKRTECKEVPRNVLNSLERKSSASKVIGEIVQVSKRSSSFSSQEIPHPTMEDSDTPSQVLLIEQLFEIPGASKRLDLEGKKHFIQSILDVPDADQEVFNRAEHDEDDDMSYSNPTCSTARKVLGGIQAMIGFFLLVVQIISVELLGPVFLNANQLFRTLLESIPGSSSSSSSRGKENDEDFLPLIGPFSETDSFEAVAGSGSLR